jgi:dTDP-4-amino-4,6-dideoxygalactose transaminase
VSNQRVITLEAVEPLAHRPALAPARIPVLRPRLPSAAEIAPYLEVIDQRRWYSNWGPLVARLESQLNRHFGFTTGGVVTTSSATAGITAALLARRVEPGSLCVMPAWTFAATPQAARAAGLTPWFHDVDSATWALDPDHVADTLPRIPGKVGAVIVVAPFGARLGVRAWEAFEDRTGVAVVIDAAASFDTLERTRIPFVVSLHATKILGAGEGGFIATTNPELRDLLVGCCNFGFTETRIATISALNAKMSEYHAAVALASLERWPSIRAAHAEICEWYRVRISRVRGVSLQPGYAPASSTTNILLPGGAPHWVAAQLLRSGIETRQWWGQGCHAQPAFANCPRGDLAATEELGARVIGLPHFIDLDEDDVEFIVDAVSDTLRRNDLYRLGEGLAR